MGNLSHLCSVVATSPLKETHVRKNAVYRMFDRRVLISVHLYSSILVFFLYPGFEIRGTLSAEQENRDDLPRKPNASYETLLSEGTTGMALTMDWEPSLPRMSALCDDGLPQDKVVPEVTTECLFPSELEKKNFQSITSSMCKCRGCILRSKTKNPIKSPESLVRLQEQLTALPSFPHLPFEAVQVEASALPTSYSSTLKSSHLRELSSNSFAPASSIEGSIPHTLSSERNDCSSSPPSQALTAHSFKKQIQTQSFRGPVKPLKRGMLPCARGGLHAAQQPELCENVQLQPPPKKLAIYRRESGLSSEPAEHAVRDNVFHPSCH